MSAFAASSNIKETTLEAVIIRADGSRVSLGTIAYWHKNPLKRWAWKVGKFFKTGR